jgi:hypothetical protein
VTLTEFIEARLAEDEAAAKGPPGWKLEHWTAIKYADKDSGRNWRVDAEPRCIVDAVAREDAEFITRHDPARVLREVEAMRKITAELETAQRELPAAGSFRDDPHDPAISFEHGEHAGLLIAARALASIWSDHADFAEAVRS